MAKDPAILFYTGDFLNGCTCLTLEERGQYITLLCLQHQTGHLSEKTIRLSLGSVSVDVIKKFAQDSEGNYFNERMEQEIQKRTQFIETRRDNGSKGGRPKKANGKPNGLANENLSEDINESEDVIKLINVPFETFWFFYDKKRGDKVKLEKKWNSLTDMERIAIMEYIPKYKEAQPDKTYRKDPQTFLNNKSWNDEIIKSNGITRKNNGATPEQIAGAVARGLGIER
jgi:uncharacterized protein YdaU (DUF1376 family)